MTDQNLSDLTKQAYLDSYNSLQKNRQKFNFKSDPILQSNEYYVRIYNLIYIESTRAKIETRNSKLF